MKNTMRMGFFVVSAVAALSGCDCGKTPPTACDTYTVNFRTPEEGATVSSPFTVKIDTSAPSAITDATLTVGPDKFPGTITADGATFSGVTLSAGQQTLKATVATAECPADATVKIPAATRSVNVAGSCTARVTAVSFPQDLPPKNGVLNSKEFTGTDMQVRVDASCAMSDVKVHILRGTTVVSDDVSFSSGVATATVKIATNSTGDARYDFFAELVQGTTPINSKVTNPEGLASIVVARNAPSCVNTTLSRQGPTTDGTPTASTFGLAASATIGTGGFAHAHFRIENGVTSAEEQIGTTQDTVLTSFSLPRTTATYNVIFEGTDGNDNLCASSKMVTVDFTPPDIVITTPSSPDGGVVPLLGNSSAVVATVTKMGQPLSCVTTDGGYGGCAVLSRRQGADGGESEIDRADVVAGTSNLTANFPASTQYSLFVGVTDDVGNKAKAQVDVDVTLTGCGVEFVSPNACPKTIFPADLVNGNYGVTFKSSNCTSRPARLLVNGQLRNSGSLSGTGVFGPNAISFTSASTVTLRAEVDNATGPATALECVVTADLSTPVITNPAGPGPVTINASLDGSSTLPGAQRVLSFSATIPVGGRADLCTTQQKDPVDGTIRAACPDNAANWYLLKSNIVTPGPSSSYSVSTDFPEGLAYSIKVVIVSGTSTNVSAPVALIVDVTRPCVAAGSMQFDRDDGAGKAMYAADGYLNKAEFAQSAPFLSFAPGCGDTAATLAANPVLIQQVISEPNVVALSGITQVVTTAGTRYNVDLTGFSGNSQVNFWVRLTDAVGNTSAYAGVTDPGRKSLSLELLDPVCNISSPQEGAPLGNKEVPGGELQVTVSTDTSVKTNGVALSLTGSSSMTTNATPVGGVATAKFNGLTGDSNWTLAATCTDVAGNAPPQVSRVLHIDLIDPTIAFISPVDGGTYSVTPKIETKLAVGGADGMQVTVDSTLRAKILVQNVDAGFVDDTETVYDKGPQILTATVADPSGNVATQSISIVVNTDNCSLNATNVYNGHYIGPSNLDGGVADFTALSDCNSLPVSLTQVDSSNMPIGTLYTGTSGSSGDVKFSAIPVADGQKYRMTINNGAGKLTTLDYFIDILPPAFTGYQLSSGSGCATSNNPCTTTTAAPATNLYFVAASTNRNVYANPSGAAAAGYLPDSAPGGSPAAHFYATIKGASGIAGGTVRIKYRNQVFGSVSVPANQSAAVDIPLGTTFGATTAQAVVIPHVLPIVGGPFTIEMVDPGGNVTTVYSANNAVVDVVAPADPNAQFTTASRNGDLPITWTSVFGDTGGDSTSGSVQYEVVWTTTSVTGNNSLQQESNYMSAGTASAVAYREPDTTQATGIGIHLPPINTYFVSARARDGVGNLSPFVAPNVAGIANLWTPVTLSGTSLNYGAAVTMGNVVGDGTQDIIVGANRAATVGNVHVYTGGSGLAAQTDCTTGCQIIAPPDGVGIRFGSAVSATGDVNGDGVNDLLVSEPQFAGGNWTMPGTATVVPLGRVFLFFGKNGAGAAGQIDTTKYVIFTGDSAPPISNPLFGASVRIVKDMNGDGRDEVLIGSPYWDTSTADTSRWSIGRVFIYAGQAAWAGTVTTVNSSSATWTLVGPDPKNGTLIAGTPPLGNGYALTIAGLASLGDIDGDGKSDLGIPMSYESSNLYQVWSSATLAAASGPLASTFATRTISGNQIPGTGNPTGLGTAAVGNVQLVDGGVPDLVLSYPSYNGNAGEVRVYSGATSTQALTFDGTNYFGNACAVGDLDGANGSDLIAAEGNTAPLSVWVAYQKPGSGFEFNCASGTKTCIGSNFYSSKVQLSGTSRLGTIVLVGDVTGDGQADLVMSDTSGKLIRILK